ncbi:hypothetical protein [Lewinella sp. IMCC34191]|uniref:hypothetical protein n=1 Tax=Lewinella sp. IMCC34191 TaxID=2259172 RepID=UPI001300A736|nr:hypothetical protein [Lewinella sp. IMCC34191]
MKICIHCAEFIDGESTKCTSCGNVPSIPTVIYNFSEDAVSYGYQYRIRYEDQVKKYGRVRIMYSLPGIHELFIFLAGAALSGIVGNISTDGFKALCNKILRQLRNVQPDNSLDEILNLLNDENKLIEFYEYVQAYYHDMPHINREVMIALRQERLANAVSDLIKEDQNLSPGQAVRIAMSKPDNQNMYTKPSIDELKVIMDCYRNLNSDSKNNDAH